ILWSGLWPCHLTYQGARTDDERDSFRQNATVETSFRYRDHSTLHRHRRDKPGDDDSFFDVESELSGARQRAHQLVRFVHQHREMSLAGVERRDTTLEDARHQPRRPHMHDLVLTAMKKEHRHVDLADVETPRLSQPLDLAAIALAVLPPGFHHRAREKIEL